MELGALTHAETSLSTGGAILVLQRTGDLGRGVLVDRELAREMVGGSSRRHDCDANTLKTSRAPWREQWRAVKL